MSAPLRAHMMAALLLTSIALSTACRVTAPYVRVRLSGSVQATRLEVAVALAGVSRTLVVDRGAPIGLPDSLSLELPSESRGRVTVSVNAFDGVGTLVGRGTAQVEVTGLGVFDLSIALSADVLDAGGQDGAGGDAATPAIGLRATSSLPLADVSAAQVSRPGAIEPGDMMWLVLFVGDNAAALTTSPSDSGWTLHAPIPSVGCGGWKTAYYYKLATASEPASYPIAFSTTTSFSAVLVAYAQVDPATPIGAQTSSLFDALPLHVDLTTTSANNLLLLMVSMNAMGTEPWVAPTGLSKIIGLPDIGVFAGLRAQPGNTGTFTVGGPTGCGSFDFVALSPR